MQEHHPPRFQDNLTQLQTDALTAISVLAGAIGFAWLSWLLWPQRAKSIPALVWAGMACLTLGLLLSHSIKGRHLRLAAGVFLLGTLGASACVALAVQTPAGFYLLLLPVICSSVLFSQFTVFLVGGLACALALTIHPGQPADAQFPILVIVLTSLVSFVSARSLYTALDWVWSSFERASQNQESARDRQGELQRVLKALDEAYVRLERANYMLTVARDEAIEVRRLKQQFAQNISHELRTPLNLIVGFAELMMQSPEHYGGSPLPPAYLRDLAIVHRNASHLQSLVGDVLDLARIEAAQMTFLPEEIDVAELMRDVENTAQRLVQARRLTLTVQVEPDLPRLWGDPTRIRQVLFNLLNNAARFTERGGITVRAWREGDQVRFAVTDTGIGMSSQDLAHIFDEFFQADGSLRRRQGGAGLGLAISRRFVELHGGRIWAESQVGRGSTFYFDLPVGRTDFVAPASPSPELAREALARLHDEQVLLAVTRSLPAAALMTRYVQGCRAVVVQDLEQARRTAQQLIPQVVVIDQACHEFDSRGLHELAQTWRASVPRAFFVACPLPGEEPFRARLAVQGYLPKPVSRENLWDTLRQFGDAIDRILVIDDDRDFVRLVARMLESRVRRYQVSGAHSGQEGLAMLQHRFPDLVLLDLALPDMDGVQVVERLRAEPEFQQLPVIITSAQDMTSLESLQGTIVIAKPEGFAASEVVRCVQHLLK